MNGDKNRLSTADQVGEAAGGITGVFAGAAIGATAGPVGVLLGGIAGAIGGWWSGRALAEAAEDITQAEDEYYRNDFAHSAERRVRERRQGYDNVRTAYYLGDLAAANPEYRSFEDVEQDLARGWNANAAAHGDWEAIRDCAHVGFERGRDRRNRPR